jgi:O-antigen/teichoic acid export membrane protein
LSSVKKLAGQTLWYGVSSIAARFINYLLTPYLTLKFTGSGFGEISLLYSAIPFMNVLFTYGMETAYFRFYNTQPNKNAVYNTTSMSLLFSTVVLTTLLIILKEPLASALRMSNHPEYFTIVAFIIGFDALATIPFARLRQEGRPVKYAVVRVGGILVNIAATYFFISICPAIVADNPNGFIAVWYNPDWGVGYVFLATLLQSIFTLLLLLKELLGFKWQFDTKLWREMLLYSLPLLIAGLGGMINETFDRIMLGWLAPVTNEVAAKNEVGIYAACYKLSTLITLAIQAFRMGAEPFFFKQAADGNAAKTYARVMKFFVITLCIFFLMVTLFIDAWKNFIQNKEMWEGLRVVPILLLANIFLGVSYNLSIWYKLGNRTMAGAKITLIGAAITLVINWVFIPYYSYMACAWATFFCYGTMMVVSYLQGQKVYPVPYAWKKLTAYVAIAVLVYAIHWSIGQFASSIWITYGSAVALLALFCALILRVERKEFQNLPVVGRWLK